MKNSSKSSQDMHGGPGAQVPGGEGSAAQQSAMRGDLEAPAPSVLLANPVSPQHFTTFLAVVDAGGKLSVAAQIMGLSQPGISHQLNELEKRIGVQLLDRARGRAARLTRAGRVFERYARSIVQMQASMYTELEQMRRRLGGHVRVGASPGPGEHWIPPLLCEFREEYPDLHVELHVSDARSIVEHVFNNDIELGVVGGHWTRAGLHFEPIWRDVFVLIAAPDHELAARGTLTMDELVGVDFIAQEPGTGLRMTLENELQDSGTALEQFNLIAELGNQESVKAAVGAGYGIGCVWRSAVSTDLAAGRLVELDVRDFDTDSWYWVVRRARRRLTRRGEALLAFLQRAREEQTAMLRKAGRNPSPPPKPVS